MIYKKLLLPEILLMKKIVAITILMGCLSGMYAQTQLYFCTAVDPQSGFCVFNNTKFITSPDSNSARIFIKVNNADGFASDTLIFKIFSVDKDGEETFSHALTQKIEKDWDMSWQNEKFNSPGTYLVKVYNDTGLLICSKSFELLKYW